MVTGKNLWKTKTQTQFRILWFTEYKATCSNKTTNMAIFFIFFHFFYIAFVMKLKVILK